MGFHATKWRWRHFDGDGMLLWASGLGELASEKIHIGSDELMDVLRDQPESLNVVTDEGEGWILDVAFRNEQLSGLTGFELILSTSNTLSETSAHAARSELADGNGYAAKSVARGTGGWSAPTGTTPTSITTPNAGTHTWTATAAWSTVYNGAIVTVGLATERLIAYDGLAGGAGRTLANTDTLDVDFDLNLGGS